MPGYVDTGTVIITKENSKFWRGLDELGSTLETPPKGLPGLTEPDETYYMVTFVSGDPYWKDCFRGMQDAAKLLGVKAVYMGTETTDPVQEATVMEQVMTKNPAGIAVTCVDPDGMKGSIDKAIAAGIPVVTFDADAPMAKRYSFLATGNYAAGVTAARALAQAIGGKGEVATSNVTGQLNQLQRQQGFEDTLAAEFPEIKLVARTDNKEDATIAAQTIAAALQAHPNIKGVFAANASGGAGVARGVAEVGKKGQVQIVSFDFNPDTLDLIDKGEIYATIGQGTWQMGFWSTFFLFMVKHNLIKSVTDWKAAGISPLPGYVDTGTVIITKENSKFWRGLAE
ncbi:MAG: substrate-binding domain-containing protein [Anaerolineae bacterium]